MGWYWGTVLWLTRVFTVHICPKHPFELAHVKTYNKTCVNREDSDQTAHPHSLIRVHWSHVFLQPPGYAKRDNRESLPYWVDVHADLSLCWQHRSHCSFVVLPLIIYRRSYDIVTLGGGRVVRRKRVSYRYRSFQLILAYSWTRPATPAAGKRRGGICLFLLFLHFHSYSSFFPVPLFHLFYYLFYLCSPFLWKTSQNDPQRLTCR